MAGKHLVLWFVVVLVVAALEVTQVSSEEDRGILVQGAMICPGIKENENEFKNIEFATKLDEEDGIYFLSGELISRAQSEVNVTGILTKCKEDDTSNITKWKLEGKSKVIEYPGFCEHVTDAGYPWSNITKKIGGFRNTCPFESKKSGAFTDSPVSLDFLLDDVPQTNDTYWSFQMMMKMALISNETNRNSVACIQYIFLVLSATEEP